MSYSRWIETWLRKRRQFLCSDSEKHPPGSVDPCRHADDDLRMAQCHNKNNASLVEVLKTDIECGWSAASLSRASYFIGLLTLVLIMVMF